MALHYMNVEKKDLERHPISEKLRTSGHYSPGMQVCKVSGSVMERIDGLMVVKSNIRPDLQGMENEFIALATLNGSFHRNTARPFLLFRICEHNTPVSCGYVMERIYGTSMQEKYGIIEELGKEDDEPTRLTIRRNGWKDTANAMSKDIYRLIKLMDEMHSVGLGHGDLGPSNIMVTLNGTIKLIDPLPYTVGGAIDMPNTIRLERLGTFRAWRNLHMMVRDHLQFRENGMQDANANDKS